MGALLAWGGFTIACAGGEGFQLMSHKPTPIFHGWKADSGPALHIGCLPGRKRPCLYLAVSNEFVAEVEILASFHSEKAARAAQEVLDCFILKSKVA